MSTALLVADFGDDFDVVTAELQIIGVWRAVRRAQAADGALGGVPSTCTVVASRRPPPPVRRA
jgi:hypothetical protein